MAYRFYCTYCGRELDQSKVCFDMLPILTGNTKDKFKILRFYMNRAELEKLVASGKKDDRGYSHCAITFPELMKYISNTINLNDPVIASLTLQDVADYVNDSMELDEDSNSVQQEENMDDLFGESSSSANTEQTTKVQTKKEQEKTVSAAIRAIEAKDTKNKDTYYTQEALKKELEVLNNVFSQGENCSFEIILNFESDNDGKPVLIGYTANAGRPKKLAVANERLCIHCGKPVIEHAGTAEHRAVTFIGDQKAGKTSTILALAHYAQNAVRGAMPDDEIWKSSSGISHIANIELVSPSNELIHDLKLYEQGIAPKKTSNDGREDAYSVNFRIKNKYQQKHYLLTLTDLPGELFEAKTGKLLTDDVLEKFQVALACDAFVLCFDSQTAVGGAANAMVQKACTWANEIQQLRESYNQNIGRDKGLHQKIKAGEGAKGLYAPVMVVYTKCPDLEKPEDGKVKLSRVDSLDRIARTYIYDKERLAIDGNQVYESLGDMFKNYDRLGGAYQARLRCSPYGYPAPNELDIKNHPDKYEFEQVGNEMLPKLPKPQPQHIDHLLRWLLMVSGCIPVDAKYRPYADPTSTKEFMPQDRYFITHTQYRMLNPGAAETGNQKDADLYEALVRCYLFENPGRFDSAFVSDYDNWAFLAKHRFSASWHRN